MEERSQLFLTENRLKILWVDSGIVATSLFKVHIPVTSKCIRLCTKLPRMEADDEVELGKEFRPPRLVAVQKLSCGGFLWSVTTSMGVRGSGAKCRTLQR